MVVLSKKRRKIAIALLAVACCLTSLFAVSCGQKTGDNTLSGKPAPTSVVNFEDEEVNVAYNGEISLNPYITAEDNNGDVYKGVAEVKDSTGVAVELFENRFTATDKNGYTVTVTAQVGGKTYTKKVKLNVIDASIPVITMDYLLQGLVGKPYSLPAITVTKAYDTTEIIPEVRVYLNDNGVKSEVTLTNGEFVPKKEGYYTIEVTATDKYGYSKSYKQEFFIQDPKNIKPMAEGVLEDFNESFSATRVSLGSETDRVDAGSKATWLNEYTTNGETRNGVLKVNLKAGDYFWMNFTRTAEELEQLKITEITFDVAIANGTGTEDAMLRWNVNGTERHNPFGVGTKTGETIKWQKATISVDTLKSYGRFATAGVWNTLGNGGKGNWLIRCAADAVIYIDEISYYAPPQEDPMPAGTLENFSNEYFSLQRYCVGTGAYPVAPSLADKTEWLETKELGGITKSGVLHVTLAYGQYLTAQFTRTMEELEALGVKSISFTMGWTATSSTTGNSLRFSDDNTETGDTPKYAGSNKLNSGAWETVTITLDELNAYKRFGGNAWNTLASDGANKNWLIRCAYYSTTVELYIDEITYSTAE